MLKVLVVEDDAYVRDVIRRVLERAGMSVLEATEGGEAMAIMASEHVDIVVTDLIMPGNEGIGTIRRLRASYPQVPVIAVSGGGLSDTYLRVAATLGAARTFSKPFDHGQLVQAVQELAAR